MSEQQNNNTQKPFLKRISDMEKTIIELKQEIEELKKQVILIKNAIKRKV